ncbi:MAG: 3'(2'),5'-bisphosphate nucleotidase CysQ [Pseudomonadota bacterium]
MGETEDIMPDEMLAELERLALEAGRAIMAIYEAADGPIEAETKADNSPVTAADLAADDIIGAGLALAFPDIPVVTEERAESQTEEAPERYFLVDPLDGTKEFVKRRGDFTVNIGLIQHGRPVLGVVVAPARRRLYAGRVGHGAVAEAVDALLHPVPDTRAPITVREPDADALSIVASKSHMNAETQAVIGAFKVAETQNAGSSLKFCLVAEGVADLYPRVGPTMEWDTAAGHAVLLAAGGEVRAIPHLRPLAYGKEGWRNGFFLAYAPGVPVEWADQALAALAEGPDG